MAGNVIASAEALGGIPIGDYYNDGTDLWIMTSRGLDRLTDVGSSTFTSPTINTPTITVPTITGTITSSGNMVGSDGTAAGAGMLSTGAGAPSVKVLTLNNEIITTIQVDLHGLGYTSTNLDIIGLAAGGAAYLTQVTTAVNGILHRCEMTCIELPTASANPMIDINLCSMTPGVDIYDQAAAGLTGYVLNIDANGSWAAGLTKEASLGTIPIPDSYLFLLSGSTTGTGTYTGGQFVIKLYGYKIR